MKVVLHADITLNGLIAKLDGNSDFTSAEDTLSFNEICRLAGCVIMGRNTFNYFNSPPFDQWPNRSELHIVLTSSSFLDTKHPNIIFANSPTKALQLAKGNGKSEVIVIGGSLTWSSFMNENMVDEVFMDIEPVFYGQGIPLFRTNKFEVNLKLLEYKSLSPQTIQLHYQVIKPSS